MVLVGEATRWSPFEERLCPSSERSVVETFPGCECWEFSSIWPGERDYFVEAVEAFDRQ